MPPNNNNNRAILWQFGLLMLVVPLQYYLTQWNPMSPTERSYSVQRLVTSLGTMKDHVLSVKTWQRWYFDCVDFITTTVKNLTSQGGATGGNQKDYGSKYSDDEEEEGESPAIEVMELKEKEGYFAGSPEPRSPRPANVKFRIGQVIKHKVYGYRGVIVGWDPVAKAPKDWLERMHAKDKPQPCYLILPDIRDTEEETGRNVAATVYVTQNDLVVLTSDTMHWRRNPNYSVLVDTRDRSGPQTTYVVEENIEIISNVKVIHPEIDDYFEHFDGTRYLARPFLKKLYPHDQ